MDYTLIINQLINEIQELRERIIDLEKKVKKK